jgi:hypothetical protein
MSKKKTGRLSAMALSFEFILFTRTELDKLPVGIRLL